MVTKVTSKISKINIPGKRFGYPNIGTDIINMAAPLIRNGIHQAPTHLGSIGVISSLKNVKASENKQNIISEHLGDYLPKNGGNGNR